MVGWREKREVTKEVGGESMKKKDKKGLKKDMSAHVKK